jgi:CRP-like cAMP-binding protein
MTSLLPILLHNLGNILYLVAFSVRDMLWLRIITVVAQLCLMPYYCVRTEPLYAPITWGALFIAVNLVQIALLILENRPIFMGEEELKLYRTVFHPLRPREFAKLLSIAEWRHAKMGEELLQQGKPVPALLLISTGRATVEMDGRFVTELGAGQFVGEMGFLTGQNASARVAAGLPTHYLAWPAGKLRSLLSATPALHLKMQGILGSDLVDKLRREAMSAAHPSQLSWTLRKTGAE